MRIARPVVAALALAGITRPAGAQLVGAALGPTLTEWNMQYTVPPGWQISQALGRVQVLASTTEAGALFVAPGMYRDFNDVGVDVTKFFQAMNLAASPVEPPAATTINGLQAMSGTYGSYDQMGQIVLSRGIAILSPHGTGLIVIGMTNQQQMPQLRQRVDEIARSFRAGGAPRVNQQAVQALAGRWMYYAGKADGGSRVTGSTSHSHEEFVQFDGVGQFSWQSSSSVSVNTPGYTGSAGGASANNDAGTYTVIGSTLVVRGRQGQATFELQLMGDRLTADGRTFLRSN
jgi:hypothetical protein